MTTKHTCSTTVMPVSGDDWIQLFPAGTINTRDMNARRFTLDAPEAVVRASTDPNVDLVIDRDHVMDIHPGQPAPAAGWIKELAVRAGGIWARVEWTPAAKEQLKNREYRYISPTFMTEKGTGRILRIIRASLVNDPAIAMRALASTLPTQTETETMDELIKTLAALLGLQGDAVSQEAVLDGVKALVATKDAVKEAVDAPADAETPEAIVQAVEAKVEGEVQKEVASRMEKVTAAAKTGEVDPAKFVPIAAVTALQKQVNELQQDRSQEKATAAVDAAVKAGKVIPALRAWALELAGKDMKAFEAFVGSAPTLIKNDGPGAYTIETAASQQGLSASDAAVAKMLGVAPDKMKAAAKAE